MRHKKINFYSYIPATIAIFSLAQRTQTARDQKSHMIHQLVKGARNLQRESYALLTQSEDRFLCVFKDCFVVNLDEFFACRGCEL